MEKQVRYVAVNPNGKIVGPIGSDMEFVKKSLIIGYRRTVSGNGLTDKMVWKIIRKIGYSVRKAEIILLEER